MVNQYEESAIIIREYLDENNLGNFKQETFEKACVDFREKFGIDILENLDGMELLNKIFLHDGDKNNLCYTLEFSKEFNIFGSISGGSAYKYNLYKNKESNKWIFGPSSKNSVILSEKEAIEKARTIRDVLIEGAKLIKNYTLETLEDYSFLEEKLNKIFDECNVSPIHSWVHKYYVILFPDKFPIVHSDKMKKDFLRKFNIEPLDGFYTNDGQFYQLIKSSGLKFYSLFSEEIVRLFFKDGKSIWDPLNKEYNDGIGDDDVKTTHYWLYAPGENADMWDKFYNDGIMAIGWHEVGNLKKFTNKSEIKTKLQNLYNDNASHRNDVHALWQFANDIQKGDIIFAKKGMAEIVGVGIVESDYNYDIDYDGHFCHTRKVNWINYGNWPYTKGKLHMKTLTDITVYNELIQNIKDATDFEDYGEEPEYPEYTRDMFLKDVFIDETDYDTLVDLLNNKKNIIVQGAPGVGKTFMAKRLAYSIMGVKDVDRVMMVQFHQSYSYEDFVMGYRPSKDGFELRHGSFYNFCKKAEDDNENPYFFIIDEINRGNLSKIFGELFMLIEADKRGEEKKIQLLYSDELFFIPKNVYIIGLMNTADRSLAMIDYALRRRFAFFDMEPGFNSKGFEDYQKNINNPNFNSLINVMNELNQEIASDESLGEGFRIGHSYFCNMGPDESDEKLKYIVKHELTPLLKEYWFDNKEKVEIWSTKLGRCIDDSKTDDIY